MLIVRILMQLISESETSEHLEFEFALEFFCALENLESFFRK